MWTAMYARVQGQEQTKLTCLQLHKKAERIGALLLDKTKLMSGDNVALVYPPGLELIAAFYGCLYAGLFVYHICYVTTAYSRRLYACQVLANARELRIFFLFTVDSFCS